MQSKAIFLTPHNPRAISFNGSAKGMYSGTPPPIAYDASRPHCTLDRPLLAIAIDSWAEVDPSVYRMCCKPRSKMLLFRCVIYGY